MSVAVAFSELASQEVRALVGLLTVGTATRIALAVALGLLLIVLVDVIGGRLTRLGLDPKNRLGTARFAVRAFVVLWASMLVLRAVIDTAPLLTAAAASLTVAAAILSVLRRVPGLIGGMTLALSGRLRTGDSVSTPEVSGRVVALGPFETRLESAAGGVVVIATHRLSGRHVTITPSGAPVPVTVRFPTGGLAGRARAARDEWLSRYAALCPYRVPATPATVVPEEAALAVTVWVGPDAVDAARRYLERGNPPDLGLAP